MSWPAERKILILVLVDRAIRLASDDIDPFARGTIFVSGVNYRGG